LLLNILKRTDEMIGCCRGLRVHYDLSNQAFRVNNFNPSSKKIAQ